MSQLSLEEAANLIAGSYKSGHKVLICGNGGLAAEAEHFAAELVGRYAFDIFVPCIALTSNSSILTAIANDYGFQEVFAHQVKVFGAEGDVVIGMTTSSSMNVRRAIEAGNLHDLTTVCLCAADSPCLEADWTIRTKTQGGTAYVQEEMLKMLHRLAFEIKKQLVAASVGVRQ